MKNRILFLGLLLSLTFLCVNCTVLTHQYVFDTDIPFAGKPGQAKIFLVGEKTFEGNTYVYSNGREIGRIGNSGYLNWYENPGAVLLYWKEHRGSDPAPVHACFSMNIEPGKEYYFYLKRKSVGGFKNALKRAGNLSLHFFYMTGAILTQAGNIDPTTPAVHVDDYTPKVTSEVVFDIECLDPESGRKLLLELRSPKGLYRF